MSRFALPTTQTSTADTAAGYRFKAPQASVVPAPTLTPAQAALSTTTKSGFSSLLEAKAALVSVRMFPLTRSYVLFEKFPLLEQPHSPQRREEDSSSTGFPQPELDDSAALSQKAVKIVA